MDTANQLIDNLTSNKQIERESELATELQTYSAKHHLNYTLEITDNNGAVPLSELDNHMDKALTVSISTDNKTSAWKPLNNKNIFILLRE